MTAIQRQRSFGILRPVSGASLCPGSAEEASRLVRSERRLLAYGAGRSYGDCCLNPGGTLLLTSGMARINAFDSQSGQIDCDSGVTFHQVLRRVVADGWFVPVVPSTKGITVGGAIAHDVHGRDQHIHGTFGRHVLHFDLLRSDGVTLRCSPQENSGLFAATIGGFGMTGVILRARIQLRKVGSSWLDYRRVPFESLTDSLRILAENEAWTYLTAWLDGSGNRPFERGYVMMCREKADGRFLPPRERGALTIPFVLPVSPLNRLSMGFFNWRTVRKTRRAASGASPYEPLLYQLDGLGNWNYLYGPAGIVQYHFVLPERSVERLPHFFEAIARSRHRPYFSIVKPFGSLASAGMMSFPCAGVMAALDFHGVDPPEALFRELDELLLDAGGRLYLAKDRSACGATLRSMYPRLTEFEGFVDPACTSSLWRRMHE